MIQNRQTTGRRKHGAWLLLPMLVACSDPGAEDSTGGELPAGVTFRIRGHQEVAIQPDGSLRPRWFGTQPIGVCLDTRLSIDASRWRVRFRFDGLSEADAAPLEPAPQAGSVLCFQRPPPPDLPSSRDLEVCATLHDGLLDRRYRLPCFRAVYDSGTSELEAAFAAFAELLQRRSDLPLEHRLVEIDRLADDLTVRGLPLLASSLRLVAVHDLGLEDTAEARAEIRRRLADEPAWLDRPEATVVKMKFTIERAFLELSESRARRAWELLADAEELARGVAAVERVAIVTRQAKILNRMGAGNEPVARLRAVLADCGRWPCHPSLEPGAHQLLGWLLLIDPDAGPRDLDEAARSLEAGGGSSQAGDRRERANQLINAAFLANRRGRDPAPILARARMILAELEPDARVHYLLAWIDIVDGLAALAADDAERAVDRCRLAALSSTRAAASGWSCLGQGHRRLGELAAAAEAFDQAVLHHALATPELAPERPLAPGLRVDDYYRAARIAVERDDPERAWRLLEALDHLSIDVFSVCEDESAGTRRRLEERRQALLTELEWTAPPLAPERRRQVAPVRRSLLWALDELQRELLSLCRRQLRPSPAAADLRAFALPDEVLSLRRSRDGRVSVARRTALARSELRDRLDRLAQAQRSGMDDETWRDLARPLAQALLPPEPESLGEITRFALHGLLQRVPLEALPVTTPGGMRWLGELTTVVLRPAFVEDSVSEDSVSEDSVSEGGVSEDDVSEGGVSESAGSDAAPLFVVDPRRNLPSGPAARDFYRQRFPEARVLFGSEATATAVRSALPAATFLHIDAHGRYDAAFPELSGLEMSDGDLTLTDFAGAAGPRHFVNLSGCHTGGGAESGDSGRYGLAGALARSGSRWVIANRSAIEDRLALNFNDAFYREIRRGSGVPAAFRSALAGLRWRHDAAAWSNLMLVGAGDEGQNRPGDD